MICTKPSLFLEKELEGLAPTRREVRISIFLVQKKWDRN